MLKQIIITLITLLSLFSSFTMANTSLEIHRVDKFNYPELKAFISVLHNDQMVDELVNSDFDVLSNENYNLNVKMVSSLKKSGDSISIVIAIDTSGSIKGDQLTYIKSAILKLIHKKEKHDKVALISFNDDVYIHSGLTQNINDIKNKLKQLQNGGKITVLNKAIFRGLELLEKDERSSLKSLVILSDGKDEGAGFTLSDAITKAQKNKIPIYALGVSGKAEFKYLDNLERLAKLTGGIYKKVNNQNDIYGAYLKIGRRILKKQVLHIDTDFPGDGKEHMISIRYKGNIGLPCTGNYTFQSPIIAPKKISLPFQINTHNEKHEKKKDNHKEKSSGIAIIIFILAILIISSIFIINKRRKNELNKSPVDTNKKDDPVDAFEDDLQTDVNDLNDFDDNDDDSLDNVDEELTKKRKYFLLNEEFSISHQLSPGVITIGANQNNEVVVDEETVSGYHAEISGNGIEWMIKDLGSTNGTTLNGKAISKIPEIIKPGDIIIIGRITIAIHSND